MRNGFRCLWCRNIHNSYTDAVNCCDNKSMRCMRLIKLTCANGYTWATQINSYGTDESEITRHFIGQWFATAEYSDDYEDDIISKCISCEFIPFTE